MDDVLKYEDTLRRLKLKYKKLYEKRFYQTIRPSKDVIPSLASYTISLLKHHHKLQAKTLLHYSFSPLSSDLTKSSIFEINMRKFTFVDSLVDDAILYGKSLVAIDKNNHIAAILINEDLCDRHVIDTDNTVGTVNDRIAKHFELYRYVDEMLYGKTFQHIPFQHNALYKISDQKYENVSDLESCYGIYEWGKMIAIRPDCNGLHLNHLLHYFHSPIMVHLGYKYQVYRTSNQKIFNLFSQINDAVCLISYDYRNHTFADGTNMNNIFQEMKDKYEYNDNQIERLKKLCNISVFIIPAKSHSKFISKKIQKHIRFAKL